MLFDKEQTTLITYAKDKIEPKYSVPSNVTSIAEYAFYSCSDLKKVAITNNVESVNSYAFNYCDSLTDVYYMGSKEDWSTIDIGKYNAPLTAATIHYNCTGLNPPRIASAELLSGINQVEITLEDVEYDSVLVTVFSKDGAMVDFEIDTILPGTMSKIADMAEGSDCVKIFIWESMESMIPICDAVEVK